MSTPNFRRGAPPSAKPTTKDSTWIAKYDGFCGYCATRLHEGESRVKWSTDRTQVVCADHR